ncbi:MAG: alpha/beta hydrolase [Flavobacteriia bacterium]|nr:alpha/beta hydrolase [Flavobacteriia bacterium]NCT59075.1 alpha/beta hydrolase [Flavobacteriia bacterium]OIP46388.1 MAG: esterase [Flavobacteriaceae bacterium CG2_30_31_66]PIV95415.1 MAG: esterase [Flavobacteriaceae bacterium CG17_big_fil_post_rev_8_21_14_2_50_31_13]PIX11661.1 MAG: esterase [Flavobacteriaceae bacterium CG_4_8_14_3_um_filter_31_8]
MNYKLSLLLYALFSFSQMTESQNQIINLWDDAIPNQTKSNEKEQKTNKENGILWITNVQNPTIEVFQPTKINKTNKAVIICPGGGYGGLAYDLEGTDIAKWFNSIGITAFVLKSRLPNSNSIIEKHLAPLQDVQRAIRYVRFYSDKFQISKNNIGIMGFSAGGHLASTLGTHFNQKISANSEIDNTDARPDFMVLMYPVITMNLKFTHQGSRENLLGKNPTENLIQSFSNELQVTESTPKTFIVQAGDDDLVPVENSLLFYKALLKAGVPAEIHIYPTGGHGFGLAIGKGTIESWTKRLQDWLKTFD